MPKAQIFIANILSSFLIVIVAGTFIICSYCFISGQLEANKAVVMAGEAVTHSLLQEDSTSQAKIDYAGAITYLEAAQQAYSENSVIKVISLIYALSTTVILGYGAKMLRLGSADKAELCKEILEKTKKQFSEDSVLILQEQNEVYSIIKECEKTTYLSFLLQSDIELFGYLETFKKSSDLFPETAINLNEKNLKKTIERLEIELIHSLQWICGSLSAHPLHNCAQEEMIKESWHQALKSINGHVQKIEGETGRLKSILGESDKNAIKRFIQEIEKHFEKEQ